MCRCEKKRSSRVGGSRDDPLIRLVLVVAVGLGEPLDERFTSLANLLTDLLGDVLCATNVSASVFLSPHRARPSRRHAHNRPSTHLLANMSTPLSENLFLQNIGLVESHEDLGNLGNTLRVLLSDETFDTAQE